MGPWGSESEDLPDVPGIDGAEDQVVRRKAFETAGWRIWEDSHRMWRGERAGEPAGPWEALRFLLDELESRS